jgi:chemotaxis protein MotB
MAHRRMPSRRKHGAGHDEEHESHERWLITYADMLTLLMVLFIVLFAMSQVDQKKFAQLADGLRAGFGARTVAFQGQASVLDGAGGETSAIPMLPNLDPGLAGSKGGNTSGGVDTTSTAAKAAVAASDRARATKAATDVAREVDNLKEIQQKITDALKKQNLDKNVMFTIDERGLVVTVVTSSVVFAGDRADLLEPGRRIVDAVVGPLQALPNRLEVDGHTNQLNVPTVNYPSAWELSTARASAVVRYLNGHGIAIDRLSAAGFAGTRPLLPPSDPRAPTMNRRVDIVVLSTLPASERALLPAAS